MFPITVYHGSDIRIDTPDDRPIYVTPDPTYKYIQSSSLVYQASFHPEKPYWTDNQNMIESLRNRPDDIQMLRDMGYDAIVYARPGEPTIGGSGWGSDKAQYLCISPSTLKGWCPLVSQLDQMTAPQRIYRGTVGPLYHGTDAVFHRYDTGDDIGIHFGTMTAATDRLNKTVRGQDVTISLITPNPIDAMRAKFAEPANSPSVLELTVRLLLKKLQNPKTNLYDMLEKLPESELLDIAAEYKQKKDAPDYAASLMRGRLPPTYRIECGGETLLETTSAEYAARFSEFAQAHLMKKSVLLMSNPLELPDLGTWPLDDIFNHLDNKDDYRAQMRLASSPSAKKMIIHDAIRAAGFDGIKYVNAVEDAGSYSYIALSSSQVVTLSPPLPRWKEGPELTQQLRRRMN